MDRAGIVRTGAAAVKGVVGAGAAAVPRHVAARALSVSAVSWAGQGTRIRYADVFPLPLSYLDQAT